MRRIGSRPLSAVRSEQQLSDVIELGDGSYSSSGGDRSPTARTTTRRCAGSGASIDADETAMIVPREVVLHAAKQLVA
ncbi:hypothetical protein ACWEWI_35825 [Streptomyces sp. NPDC003753]